MERYSRAVFVGVARGLAVSEGVLNTIFNVVAGAVSSKRNVSEGTIALVVHRIGGASEVAADIGARVPLRVARTRDRCVTSGRDERAIEVGTTTRSACAPHLGLACELPCRVHIDFEGEGCATGKIEGSDTI